MSRLQRHQMAQYRPSGSQVGESAAVPETAPRTTGRSSSLARHEHSLIVAEAIATGQLEPYFAKCEVHHTVSIIPPSILPSVLDIVLST
jgi:hypothetical protein